MSASNELFPCVRVEGAILPADLLQRVAAGAAGLEGLRPEDYHLVGEKVNEATSHAWNRLSRLWEEFRPNMDRPAAPTDEAITLKKWLLPFWQALGYGQLDSAKAFEIDGKAYPISHLRYQSPIHLVSFRQDLDRRLETGEGKKPSPHGMVQEFLNRSDPHLWAFLSNGLRLRILRDNIRLTRQAFVEFDLQAMFDGKQYADFALLWRLCHESRVKPEKQAAEGAVPSDNPADCWLERWSKLAAELGLRALDQLRVGVENAIEALGRGFLHPRNVELIRWLREREPHAQEYYRQLLRVVYRLLFLFVAEDRGLLLNPTASDEVRDRYTRFYSTARLRRIAELTRGTPHTDLYHALELVLKPLGQGGCPALGLSELGGLFDPAGTPNLNGCFVGNADLLEAIRALSVVNDGKSQRSVDYRNLGSEELGSVYESLLELKPQFTPDPPSFVLKSVAGNERKTTGSYYTPTSLITCLLDSALDPVLEEAAAKPEAEAAILNLKVCDPACGSGHFLIAAAHRIAHRLAAVRTQEEEPAPDAVRHALRDVIGRCIHGVDINPMAVELCQVALWMEAMEPGKPLSFLKHRIQCGNSLLGATPALLAKGIPDEAFEPIEGDNPAFCREWKKINKQERVDQRGGQGILDFFPHLGNFATEYAALDTLSDDTPQKVREKADRYERLVSESSYRTSGRFLADVWCAAFVWQKAKQAFDFPITERIFRRVETQPNGVEPWLYNEVVRLRDQYQFFHWHLAFPGVFQPRAESADGPGWTGGFDVVLGNPPWERIKLQEQEWFTAHGRVDIAAARTASIRGKMIAELVTTQPTLYQAFLEDRRKAEGESHLVRQSERFPLCGRGDVNTYSLFAELNRNLISPTGRVGCIVPSGIATDDTTKVFFGDLVENQSLVSLLSFFEIRLIFPATDSRNSCCLLTLTGKNRPCDLATFVFEARSIDDLASSEKRFTLSPSDFTLLNPNTRTCPVFRTAADAVLTKAIYRRVPVLIRETPESNPWGIRFMAMLHMANDSGLFRTAEQLDAEGWTLDGNIFRRDDATYLPLYEAKMLHQFDHRWATYDGTESRDVTLEEKHDPNRLAIPRYWVPATDVNECLQDPHRNWMVGYRRITRNTDIRTFISFPIPRCGVGDSGFLVLTGHPEGLEASFLANTSSFAFDYASRQKVGGTNASFFIVKQLPVLPPTTYGLPCPWSVAETSGSWLLLRVVELTYTAWDLQPFAADCGFDGPPFRWDDERRFLLRCELDAAFFHLYLGTGAWQQATGEPDADFARLREAFATPRDAVAYILDTFPLVRRADEQAHGCYRTKERILSLYDTMGTASTSGTGYATPLDPPPADPRCRHADRSGTLAPGALRTLNDLLADLPSDPFPLRLTEADVGRGQPTDWICHPLTAGDPLPPEDTWVLIRAAGLRRGSTPLTIAVGRLNLNPIDGGMEVILKGAIPPATLRLAAEQWPSFRPLAVLTPVEKAE